eukprot:12359163-Prorocentrum_lima.AAC.1
MVGSQKGVLLLRKACFRVLDVPFGFQRHWEPLVFRAARALFPRCSDQDRLTLERKFAPEWLTKE